MTTLANVRKDFKDQTVMTSTSAKKIFVVTGFASINQEVISAIANQAIQDKTV